MNHDDHQSPPRWINWLLQKLSGSDRLEEIQGDLYELYNYWIQKEGIQAARQRYLFTVLSLIMPFNRRPSAKTFPKPDLHSGLVGSYLKSSQRSFIKNLSFSLINLSGLTIGFTVCVLIFLFVKHELSYDKFLPAYEQIVRIQPTVTQGSREQEWATSEGFLAPALKSYPEVENFTRILRLEEEISFTINAQEYRQTGGIAVDDAFFEVFSIPFVYGDRLTALKYPDGIVISKTVATRLFGDVNPVGRIIQQDQQSIRITGVFDDLPSQSHLKFDVVVPLKAFWPDADQSRNMYAFYSYLKLRSPEDIKTLSAKLLRDWRKIYGIENKEITNAFSTKLELIPASAIHLTSKAEKEFGVNGSKQVVFIFIAITALILLIVMINYINLSNAMALKRVREMAIRKTIGASKIRLFLAFVVESHLFTLMAIVLGFGLAITLLHEFNSLTGKQFDWSVLLNRSLIVSVIFFWVLISTLSAAYPAAMLSSVNPIHTLRSGISIARGGALSLYFRRGLLIFQFAIASLLIVSAHTVWKQMDLIDTLNPGFNKDNLLVIAINGQPGEKMQLFREKVDNLTRVEHTTLTSAIPGKRIVYLTVRIPSISESQTENDQDPREMRVLAVDENFVKTMNLQVLEGRDFSIANPADRESAFLLNEAAIREFNIKDPVGKPFEYTFGKPKKGQIIGVIKDFNYASIHSRVEPLMIHLLPWYSFLCIRLNGEHPAESIGEIEKIWKEVSASPFTYSFLDETYDAQYKAERITSRLTTYLALIAVIFATLGLFGIVSFFAVLRTREIGIRKVFGASQISLMKELSIEYIFVVIAGNIIALIPALWLTGNWLQKFTIRVELPAFIFVLTLMFSVVLAFCSILQVLLKTSRVSPAIVLRKEN